MSTQPVPDQPVQRAVEVHHPALIPTPVHPTTPTAAVMPVQSHTMPTVTTVVLPNGQTVTGYTVAPAHPQPVTAAPSAPVSRTAVNAALGGLGLLAAGGGLLLLTTFITALTALITQLITLAAVIFGGWIAAQVLTHRPHKTTCGGTTVTIRKAVFKRNHFRG